MLLYRKEYAYLLGNGGGVMSRKRLEKMKSAVSDIFELPKEIMLNLPKISMIGNNQMLVETTKA